MSEIAQSGNHPNPNGKAGPEARAPGACRLVAAGLTDLGKVRTNNEDAFLIAGPGSEPLPGGVDGRLDPATGPILLAVSDGMGGAQAGEVASALVVAALRRSAAQPGTADLADAVARANREVWEAAQRPETAGMGATLVAITLAGEEAQIAAVGDSRAYLLRDGELRQLTRDQTFEQALREAGVVRPGGTPGLRHVLLAAMGQGPQLQAGILTVPLRPGDRLLLCSDGLYEEVPPELIRSVLRDGTAPSQQCRRLIRLANDHGGRDNVTAVVAWLEPRSAGGAGVGGRRVPGWLNRTVWGMAITSFFSDLGHEAQSTLLPSFIGALGLPPAALGLVEGVADAASSFIKLAAGWLADRLPHRKPLAGLGYLATGLASGLIALARGLPGVLGGKLFGWLGRGLRGPLRDAMLTDAIPVEARGRAFGFHRLGDTVGAILGPGVAVQILAAWHPADLLPGLRVLLAWTMVPGVLAAVAFFTLVGERPRSLAAPRPLRHSIRELSQPFRRYLAGVGLFGFGDYAHTLLILAATQLLAPSMGLTRAAATAGAFYVLHNVVYAAAAFPAGALADRYGHRRVLAAGYGLSVAVPLGLIASFLSRAGGLPLLAALFAIAGVVNGMQDTLEATATADLVPASDRGLGFGLLGTVNGVGDLVSSLVVGLLWTLHPVMGFGYAAICMALGAVVTAAGAGRSR